MSELFLKIVNMSISASWLVLAVLLLRFVLKKAPKWVNVLLWGFVADRLICPFSFESVLSLIPSAETISPDIMMDPTPQVHTGIDSFNNVIDPIVTEAFTPEGLVSMNPLQLWISLAALVWGIGIAAMLIYTTVSYLLLRRKVTTAVRLKNNIFQSENVDSPFVLGIIKPKIYLPFWMDGQSLEYVIAHEESHIRRKDHWWKPFGFVLLTLHWFNPLMWIGYILLCRDIELACDEKVIKEMDNENKANYTEALVTCSVNRRSIAACPLAFGEVGVKDRVKSVMNYRKPAFWIIIAAVISCAIVAVCFLTNPTDSYGIGIQAIHGATYKEDDRTPVIELDYFLLRDGEEHYQFQADKWIRQLSKQEAEYTKDGSIPYDGSLGEYRMMLEFSKTGPSASFRSSHEEGTVYNLKGLPESFGGTVQYKVVYPNDEGMIIYIGSDVPFSFKEPTIRNVRYYFGPMQIRLYRLAEDGTVPFIEPELQADVVATFSSGYKTYYRLRDGRWKADGHVYQYRHQLSGKLPDGMGDASFVYLSNLETITFEQAFQSSGFGDDPNGFFPTEDAVLVDFKIGFDDTNANNTTVDTNDEYLMMDPAVTQLDAMIADTILKLPWDTESDAIMNTEGHIILAHEIVSGTPVKGQLNHYLEEILLVHYVKERYRVEDGYQDGGLIRGIHELCDHTTGTALITLGTDDQGQYYLKEFRDLDNLEREQTEKYAATLKTLDENKTTYEVFLDGFGAVSFILRHLDTSFPGNIIDGPWIENSACDYGGDGMEDFTVTRAVEMLRALEW